MVLLALARGELGACLAALGRAHEAAPLLRTGAQALRDPLPTDDPRLRAAQARILGFDGVRAAAASGRLRTRP